MLYDQAHTVATGVLAAAFGLRVAGVDLRRNCAPTRQARAKAPAGLAASATRIIDHFDRRTARAGCWTTPGPTRRISHMVRMRSAINGVWHRAPAACAGSVCAFTAARSVDLDEHDAAFILAIGVEHAALKRSQPGSSAWVRRAFQDQRIEGSMAADAGRFRMAILGMAFLPLRWRRVAIARANPPAWTRHAHDQPPSID